MDRRIAAVLTSLAVAVGLAGCLFGSSIGGTVSGLPSGTSVTLQNNGADNLTVQANGSFEFETLLDEGEAYSVTVLTQPTGATCSVSNGTGTVASGGKSVSNVSVTCTRSASITGTVAGLTSGAFVRLVHNGTTTLDVTGNGNFAFNNVGVLAAGTAYAVTVESNSPGLVCTVANGTGNVIEGTPTAIAVTCVPS